MRKLAFRVLAVAALTALLSAPGSALAVGYEDSLDDCRYPETFDLMVMRPLGFTTLLAGGLLYIPAFPIAYATVNDEIGKVTENLIQRPAHFTFRRKLGECTGTTLAY